ncbi:MAG: ferrochelatase [Chloroflexi bacterium]|nr:ferrochelatase [Chloroflexota bacterium]
MDQKIGVLLINIGTPDAPTSEAVYTFLSEFLRDPFVVDYPRWLWKPILEKIILRTRPKKSARNYAKIWKESGSPLLYITRSIASKLEKLNPDWQVAIGMRYGNPSIKNGLHELIEEGVTQLVILPLFPQYSSTTSLTALRHTEKQIASASGFHTVTTIESYHDHPAYISALAGSIEEAWSLTGKPAKTLFSFHGVPQRYIKKKGEPYQTQCYETFRLVSEKVGLEVSETAISFQSRFGPESWLKPYTDETLMTFGAEACKNIQVLCPGFAADCLETLEEIAIQGKNLFTQAGGEKFHYIPALNDNENHIQALSEIIIGAIGNKAA